MMFQLRNKRHDLKPIRYTDMKYARCLIFFNPIIIVVKDIKFSHSQNKIYPQGKQRAPDRNKRAKFKKQYYAIKLYKTLPTLVVAIS